MFISTFCKTKSAQPLNEVRLPNALPEYYIKYSQKEKAKSDYFNRLKSKLSFEPSKLKGIYFYEIKRSFLWLKTQYICNFLLKIHETYTVCAPL